MSDATESNFDRNEQEPQRPGSFTLGFFLTAGVLLPLAALLVELSSRWCAEELFDPIPTWWHVLLVAFVPITNFQTWLAFNRGYTKRPGWLSFANGVSIFITLFYAVIFAPTVPIAIIGIIFLPDRLITFSTAIFAHCRYHNASKNALVISANSNKMVSMKNSLVFIWFLPEIGMRKFNLQFATDYVKANSTDAQRRKGSILLSRFSNHDLLKGWFLTPPELYRQI